MKNLIFAIVLIFCITPASFAGTNYTYSTAPTNIKSNSQISLTDGLPQKPYVSQIYKANGDYTDEYLKKAGDYNSKLYNKLRDNFFKKYYSYTSKGKNLDGSTYNITHYNIPEGEDFKGLYIDLHMPD